MTPDKDSDAWLAGCAGEALDRCRSALAGAQEPVRSWTKENAFGRPEPVSEADLAVEDILAGAFTAFDPDLPVVAEERRPDLEHLPGRCIIIDPIDGTIPFLNGSPLYAITVCLVRDGHPACAIVDLPAFAIRVLATPGQGLSAEGDLARLPDFGPRSVLMWPAQLPTLRGAGREAGFSVVEAVPATSVKMLLVALGRAAAAVRAPAAAASVAPWDYIAPALIVCEAGGTVRDDQDRDLAQSAPAPVNGWLACSSPQLIGPLHQIMAHAGERRP